MTIKDAPRQELYDLYVVKRFSVKEIASHYRVSERSVYHRLAEMGITRPRSDKVQPYFSIRLSPEEAEQFVEVLMNAREPSEALKEAARRYQARSLKQ